ncbi:M48 family metallopeptidase [Hydrogenophaga sp.]|uniref:M48 family metallopeptidase n=1 Tax=Hydrogenophaga sp. TaxID=1904254 RepID=UPI00271FE0BB|nr:SprT family zinc-dependent metalloprotease [Hydrogenophaga sp.]MDO9435880.1 SprT family zinc-dependent metalloprotease [Hydrogenophaga sp.]
MQRFVQLALDLFGGTAPEPVAPVRPSAPPPLPRVVDAAPALPMHQVFQPATWHHPRANRTVRLGACDVAYEFKRGKRRTIGLSVSTDGLSVSAPRWTPVGEVEALLLDKSAWVLEKLQSARQRAGEMAQARIHWADGVEFDYLGERMRLQLDPTHAFTQVGAVFAPATEPGGMATLRLGLSQNAQEAQIRDAAQAWLMKRAKALFTERLDHFAPQLGVRYSKLRLSSAGTRWGSASADGSIRLNWRLIHLKLDMIDYVVVHELSHLHHMDHSPQFWDVVARVLPDHAQRRRALREAAVPLDDE